MSLLVLIWLCTFILLAIKGQVVYADEDNAWLTYFIKVTQVIKGKKGLKVNDIIEVRKKSMCIYPHLARRQVVLFIGKMKRGQYIFDVDAFVKKLTHPRDIRDVNELAKRIGKGNCKWWDQAICISHMLTHHFVNKSIHPTFPWGRLLLPILITKVSRKWKKVFLKFFEYDTSNQANVL